MSGPSYPPPLYPPPSPRSRTPLILAVVGLAVVVVVVIALAVTLVVVGGDDGQGDEAGSPASSSASSAEGATDEPTTDEPATTGEADQDVIASATTFVEVFNTFGPDDVEDDGSLSGYEESVDALITPDLAATLDGAVDVAETLVADGGSSEATVAAVGIQSLGDDEATALVAANQTRSDGRLAPSSASTRNVVSLVRVDGAWLVDDLQPVTEAPGPLQIEGAEAGATEAGAAALTALPQILGYDYRTVEKDFAAARDLLSDSYRPEFDQLVDLVVTESKKDQVVVTLTPLHVGLTSYDDTSAKVLVFANQGVTRGAGAGTTQVAVVLEMVLVDGTWLVDGLGA